VGKKHNGSHRIFQVDLAVDTYLRIHGHASVGSQQDFEYCIGAEAGYDTFAQITAP
jgi:chitinase